MTVLKLERKGMEKKFFDLCSEIITPLGYEVYDLDYLTGTTTLRVFIRDPKTGSAVLEDCIKVDKALTPMIEEEDWIPETLVLEVSSPGLFRALNQVKHFEQALGEDVSLVLTTKDAKEILPDKLKGQKKVVGLLERADSQGIDLDIDGIKVNLSYENIKKANLESKITQ